uniref:Uncharacterized protein n=1 Tax=Cucumis melo TaxID=3656 RepID=A0A9I9E334_CUCME
YSRRRSRRTVHGIGKNSFSRRILADAFVVRREKPLFPT